MTFKTDEISDLLASLPAPRGDTERHHQLYLGFFSCFNAQKFYEAHEVLEELWRETPKPARGADVTTTNWQFYKGLIQVAAVFVHLQKGNLSGAASLLARARENLHPYSVAARRAKSAVSDRVYKHEGIDVAALLAKLDAWHKAVACGKNPYRPSDSPHLAPKGVVF